MQIVIPMAGRGIRFKNQGYNMPKPLLDLDGETMISRVIRNLMSRDVKKLVLIMSEESKFDLKKIKQDFKWAEIDSKVINYTTEGPAITSSLAREFLDMESPLIIANSDQLIAHPIANDYKLIEDCDGIIWAMEDQDPKWSFVKIDERMMAVELAEKRVISDLATVGIYAFGKAQMFFSSLEKAILGHETVNDEYYVAPLFNHLINKYRIRVINLGTHKQIMFGLGTPEDYESFLQNSNRSHIYENSNSLRA